MTAATSAERDGDTVRITLDPAMLPSVAALVAAEASYCPQARFTLEVTGGQAFLIAEVPGLNVELPGMGQAGARGRGDAVPATGA